MNWDGYINYPMRDPNAYALRCMGDSMRPRIREGEFVIIEPNSEPISGDEVLVKSLDGRVMIKTLLYQRDGRLHLLSVNEAHPLQSTPLEDVDKIKTEDLLPKNQC
jgi:phage repressor protein C with HTH and peptisase S24 domain